MRGEPDLGGDALEPVELPPSERLRRMRNVRQGEKAEEQLYEHAVDLYLGGTGPSRAAAISRDTLLTHRAEVMDSVERDRATFRELTGDYLNASASYQTASRFFTVLATALAVCLSVAFAVLVAERYYIAEYLDRTMISLGLVLALTGALIPLLAPRVSSFFASRATYRAVADDYHAAKTLLIQALVEVGIPEYVRRFRNRTTTPATDGGDAASSADGILRPIGIANLVEAYRGGGEVETTTRAWLRGRIRNLIGASIGVAGPRGVGKSTLIRSVFAAERTEYGHFAIEVAAPVRYDPREFVLTLFAQVCEQVIGPREDPGARWSRTRVVMLTVGMLLIAAGGLVAFWTGSAPLSTRQFAGAFLGFLGVVGVVGAVAGWLPAGGARQFAPPTTLAIRSSEPGSVADDLLREIRFQLTYSAGFGGKLTIPFGEVSGTGTYSLAARQESFPEIVARFRAFLEALARRHGKVLIAIDELDKLPLGDALRFLDDIKGLFGIEGCFFVLAVSEDALALFERRGVPARDSFDSAFDEVVRVSPFSLAQSTELLERRTENLGPELCSVCHVLAGGLARDVIRYARRIADMSAEPIPIVEALRAVVTADVAEKIDGTRASLPLNPVDPSAIDVDRWLDALRDKRTDAGRLAAEAAEFPAVSDLVADAPEPASVVYGSMAMVGAHAYVASTVLALADLDPRLSLLVDAAADLGTVRFALASNPARAWDNCNEVRSRYELVATTPSLFDRAGPVG
jgi:Cdc6-like AAA superfamily ATPase